MKTELERLKERILEIERLQGRCNHEWGKVEFEPEEQEIKTVEYIQQGIHSYPVEVGTGSFKTVNRWSRVCKKCEKKEYTYEIETVAVQTEKRPKFK